MDDLRSVEGGTRVAQHDPIVETRGAETGIHAWELRAGAALPPRRDADESPRAEGIAHHERTTRVTLAGISSGLGRAHHRAWIHRRSIELVSALARCIADDSHVGFLQEIRGWAAFGGCTPADDSCNCARCPYRRLAWLDHSQRLVRSSPIQPEHCDVVLIRDGVVGSVHVH